MNLILPRYMLHVRRFKCPKCSFAFIKATPSRVEKCPMCSHVVFERGLKEGDTLDSYSAMKLRWYEDQSGEKHRDEITRRKYIMREGQKIPVVVDSNGKIIGELPIAPVVGDVGKGINIKQE